MLLLWKSSIGWIGSKDLVRSIVPTLSEKEALKIAYRLSEWQHWIIYRGYCGIPLRPRPSQVILVYVACPHRKMDIIDIDTHGEGLVELFIGSFVKKDQRGEKLCDDQSGVQDVMKRSKLSFHAKTYGRAR